jgi:hypothetical protein
MATLAIAFILAWVAVSAYVSWLAIQNRRLVRRLDALEAAIGDEGESRLHSRAA